MSDATKPMEAGGRRRVRLMPEGYRTATPWRVSKDNVGLIEFVKRAFAAEEIARVPSSSCALGRAEFRIGDSIVMAFGTHTKGRSIMDWKLELVAIPVSDVDRAKAFYTEKVGFNADHDHTVSDELRFVQLTPPGSACSIAIGKGIVDSRPGSIRGVQLVVSDIEVARRELVERGVEVSEVQDLPGGPFVFFSDPDGNGWSVQQGRPETEQDA